MKTFIFPGQGSQQKGMGGDLFDQYKELTEQADDILGYSIKQLCLENPKKELGLTQFTQPALYVVNALSYYRHIEQSTEQPDFVAGHSLGEFNALLAAQCFSFEAGLKLVKKRGQLMSEASGGGMAAVMNASKAQIETILEDNDLSNIDLANYNTGAQIVISGLKEEIHKAQPFFETGMMQYHLLNTSGAFHSRFMEPSKKKFENYIKKFKLSPLQIPVISNVTALPYQDDEILTNLSNQIASAVKWLDSIHYLMDVAPKDGQTMEFVEIGHGKKLSNIVGKIKRDVARAQKTEEKAEAAANEAAVATPVQPAHQPAQSDKPTSFIAAEQLVKDFNIKYPVGTKVKSTISDYDELQTGTEAMVLFGHRAAVYMKDYNGYFDLNEITPL